MLLGVTGKRSAGYQTGSPLTGALCIWHLPATWRACKCQSKHRAFARALTLADFPGSSDFRRTLIPSLLSGRFYIP
jgi:hypothetical protein